MGLTINVRVESNDSSVIDELFKVSDLTGVVWATWAESLDFSLEVSNSSGSTSDKLSLHFGEVCVH